MFPQPHLSASTSKGVFPWAQLFTIQPESMAAKKPRAIPVPIGQKGWRDDSKHCIQWPSMVEDEARMWKNKRGLARRRSNLCGVTHLQQTVSNQCHQKLVAIALPHNGSVLWGVHAGEIKHGYIWLSIVVDGKVQCGQLVVCGEICSFTGIRQ